VVLRTPVVDFAPFSPAELSPGKIDLLVSFFSHVFPRIGFLQPKPILIYGKDISFPWGSVRELFTYNGVRDPTCTLVRKYET